MGTDQPSDTNTRHGLHWALVVLAVGAVFAVGLPMALSAPGPGAATTPALPLVPSLAQAHPVPANSAAPATIVDPTVSQPDPAVVWDPATQRYRMYTTKQRFGNVPEWEAATPLGPWTFVGDALPKLPVGTQADDFRVWAPEVADINGIWTMWGSAAVTGHPALCLYRATARTAAGPFVVDPRPVFPCAVNRYGNIDPQMVESGGDWWLIYKPDLNAIGLPTQLDALQLGADGLPTGSVHVLLTSSLPWERGLVEAPGMVLDPVTKQWWVTYSGGQASADYEIAAAPCATVAGPCDQRKLVHLVSTNAQGSGPGEQKVFVDIEGGVWMTYSTTGAAGGPVVLRPAALVRLGFTAAGTPYVAKANQPG